MHEHILSYTNIITWQAKLMCANAPEKKGLLVCKVHLGHPLVLNIEWWQLSNEENRFYKYIFLN